MPTNETRRELLNRAKSSGFPGSITEVFQAADQGIDLIEQHQMQQQQEQEMQVANTPQQQETGLREQHAMGNTQASMAFPDVQPNQSFNTVGMQAPIDIQKIDNQGHLVESYKNVPPGIQDLPTGPSEGTIIESPAAYQKGGFTRQDSLNIYNNQEELNKLAEHINLRVQKRIPSEPTVSLVSRASKKNLGDLYNDYYKKSFEYYKEYYEKDQDPKDNPFTLKQNPNSGNLVYPEGKRKGEYVGHLPELNKYKTVKPSEKGTIEDVKPGEVWYQGKITKNPQRRKVEKILKIDPIQLQLLPTDNSEMKPIEAGIPIDKNKYKYSKYYKNGNRVRVIDKSKKGKTNKIQTVDDVSLDMFNQMYKKQKGGFNFNKSFDYSQEGIQDRKDNSPYKGLSLSEKLDLGLTTAGMAPGVGIIPDAINTVSNLGQGAYHSLTGNKEQASQDYTNAAWAAGGMIPVAGQAIAGTKLGIKAVKASRKLAEKVVKTVPDHSLYRVVDATGNVQAAKFGSTIPDVATTGRRTGYKDLQKNTPFDVLNTTTDQKWIAGKGPDDPTSLFNTYGGKNPHVVKISRGMGDETLDVVNTQTNVLNDFQHPYTQNVGKWNSVTGQFDLPLELGSGVYTTIGKSADDLAKIPPGSIVNPNYLSRGDKNITTIFGPKGTKVRNVEGVMSKAEYLEAVKKDPNFKFNKGGFKSKYQVGGLRNHMMNYLHTSGRDTNYVNTVMGAIAEHESFNNPDQIQISQKKDGTLYDGPGRGKYQYEIGDEKGGNTALNRTRNFLDDYTDKTLSDYPKLKTLNKSKSFDFTNLTSKEQDAVFIGDKIYGGSVRVNAFNAVTKNRTTPPSREEVFKYWLTNHKGKVNGKEISKLTEAEIEVERKKWNSRTKNVFKRGGYKRKYIL